MNKHDLLELYEIRGEESDFLAAKPLYEQALAEAPSAQLLIEYGYLRECHARRELRQAVEQYRRAVELDPSMDKARYQLIQALAAFDPDEMIALYERRVADAPGEVREYRFLASAYAAAGRHDRAREAVDAGLDLAPDDRMLIATRGDVKAASGDPDGALADWRRALELESTDDIAPLYSIAFLLEREDRLDEALETWRSIVAWNEERGYRLSAEYPESELERVRQKIVDA